MATAVPPASHMLPARNRQLSSSNLRLPPSGDAIGVPLGLAQKKALQILRETKPPPVRRQSAPTVLPPRGALPQIDKLGVGPGKPLSQHVHRPSLVGKPPPPETRPPLAAIAAGRRHSTGEIERRLSTVRPPPPRGPPPVGPTATAPVATGGNKTAAPLQAVREDRTRRSSDTRAPPPGPPPLMRRSSAAAPGPPASPPAPVDSSSRRVSSLHQQGQATAAAAAAAASGGGKKLDAPPIATVQQEDSDVSAARRVSFSAYRGQPGDGNSRIQNAQHDSSGSAPPDGDGGRAQTVPSAAQPLPDLQQRRRSSGAKEPGKPSPPRPPGDPPSAGQIRRYSIANEISSEGTGDFSRRMSMIKPPPQAIPESGPVTSMVHHDVDGRRVSTGSGNNTLFSAAGGGQQRPQPSSRTASPETQAAVLWYNTGVTRQKERDAKGAVECYERAARDGHAKAQHNLAAIYEKGMPGIPKNEREAVRLFRLAADEDLAESCYSLAMHLKFGLGVEQDDAQCVHYLEKASELGLAKAIFNLGLMYEKHRGVSQDAPEIGLLEATRECYQVAAEAGVIKAMVNIGVLYLSGRLPGRDQGEALAWFQKAADEGDLSGLWNLSLCYERGVGAARDPIVAQALQQQCRDRERITQQHKRSPSVVGAISGPGVAAGSGRRSSDPSVIGTGPTNGSSIDTPLVTRGAKQKRRSSSPVPFETPPPPAGPPPAHVRRDSNTNTVVVTESAATVPDGGDAGQGQQHKQHGPAGVTKPQPISGGYTYVPKGPGGGPEPLDSLRPNAGGPGADRRGSGATAAEVNVVDPVPLEPVIPFPVRERKDSLLLKPTPLAIARVKAAVERRKSLEASAISAAGNNS